MPEEATNTQYLELFICGKIGKNTEGVEFFEGYNAQIQLGQNIEGPSELAATLLVSLWGSWISENVLDRRLLGSVEVAIANGDKFALSQEGTTVKVWKNGSVILSETDTMFTSGYSGIATRSLYGSGFATSSDRYAWDNVRLASQVPALTKLAMVI
jgi:hypothetical protein